jgi:cell wall-associated NlpC family hydrolase
LRRRSILLAACLCALCFSTTDAAALQRKTAPAEAPKGVVTQPAAPKTTAAPKASVKPAAKPAPKKTAPAPRKIIKAAVQPTVSAKTKEKAETIIATEITTDLPQDLEREISKFFGLRYRLGGDGQSGIDCSALVKKVYSDVFGVELPRSSTDQSRFDTLEKVDEDDLKTGDLLFFGPNRKRVNHVGMYLSGGYFLHAARSEGVTISKLDKGYWRSRFMFSKRARGLEIEEGADADLDLDLESVLKGFSLSFSGNNDDADGISILEAGIQLNDTLELVLSGFFQNALADNTTAPDLPADELFNAPAPDPERMEGGFRLSALLSPLEWLKLIPSVTQVENQGRRKEGGGHTQQVGLETWMILPSSRVAVFMAAHADNREDLLYQPLAFSPDWDTMDVAIGLHYQLSNSLRFSLWGTYSYAPDQRAVEDSGRRSSTVEDVSFQMQMKF